MEETGLLAGILPIILMIIVGMYYGLGKNIEISSNMLTRELVDAERMQKERIVRKYSNKSKELIDDASFKKAVTAIARIDELDI